MEKSLLHFNNPMELITFMRRYEIFDTWRIESGLMNYRSMDVKMSKFYEDMSNLFVIKNMFYKKVSGAEVTTWMDTFIHLERLMNLFIANYDIDTLKKISITFEYVVKMSKKSRVDVIIKYNDDYLLFEFSTVDSMRKIKNKYDKKRLELIIYKDLMRNYIPYTSRIILYPFIGLYEFDSGELVQTNKDSNLKQVAYAYQYIKKFLIQE
jgi:hypothetical protein